MLPSLGFCIHVLATTTQASVSSMTYEDRRQDDQICWGRERLSSDTYHQKSYIQDITASISNRCLDPASMRQRPVLYFGLQKLSASFLLTCMVIYIPINLVSGGCCSRVSTIYLSMPTIYYIN